MRRYWWLTLGILVTQVMVVLLLFESTRLRSLPNIELRKRCLFLRNYTRKVLPEECVRFFVGSHLQPRTFPLLVTALGGSGTHYVTNLLRVSGVRVLHESVDTDGSVGWPFAANDFSCPTTFSGYPYGRLGPDFGGQVFFSPSDNESSTREVVPSLLSPRFEVVFHATRCPLDAIAAFTSHDEKAFQFVDKCMRHIHDSTMPLTGPILPSSKCLKETVWPNHACKCEAKHRDTRKSDRRHHQVYCESHEDSRHHIYQPKQFVSNHSTRHGLSYRSVRRRHSHFRTTHATSDALKSPSSHKECIAVDWPSGVEECVSGQGSLCVQPIPNHGDREELNAWKKFWFSREGGSRDISGVSTRENRTCAMLNAARAWVLWNNHIARFADWQFRVEDITPKELCERFLAHDRHSKSHRDTPLERDTRFCPDYIQAPFEFRSNHRKHANPMTFQALQKADATLARQIKFLAAKFGYEHHAACNLDWTPSWFVTELLNSIMRSMRACFDLSTIRFEPISQPAEANIVRSDVPWTQHFNTSAKCNPVWIAMPAVFIGSCLLGSILIVKIILTKIYKFVVLGH